MLNYVQKKERGMRVGRVDFGLLSAKEIKRLSVVNISDINIYHRGMPQVNGINDHRMGTVDRRLMCGTCGRDVKMCPGHCGSISLPLPCFHIGYVEQTIKVLRSVCYMCSKLVLTKDELENIQMEENANGKALFGYVYMAAKSKKKCPFCKCIRPTYTRQTLTIKLDWPPDAECEWLNEEECAFANQPFTAEIARSILHNISNEDAEMLGFHVSSSHPRDMIMQEILVPPPIARPAIMASEGSRARGQDDITHKLQDINKRCIEINTYMTNNEWDINKIPSADLIEKWSKLQNEVYSYISNNIRGQKSSTTRSIGVTKSIVDRLKGKEGRVRGNLMGKRVNFSARSVITPDPIMDVDQVGVPHSIAMTLTVPERITPNNIIEMRQRVLNGNTNIFGAECVITSDNNVIQLESCEDRSKIRLQYGWVIERFLKNDDMVIFNRQPSLHRMGMMGHRVILVKGSTFRLNLSCANPYNADFDGDEMNMHVVQSPCAMSEVAYIMAVPAQIISPQANKPVMGIVQDSLLGSHMITKPGVFLDKDHMMQFISWIKYPVRSFHLPPPAINSPIQLWTGAQLFSMLLPPTFLLLKCAAPTSTKLPESSDVIIKQGLLMCGCLSKQTLGTSSNGIIDVMYRDFGANLTVRFMGDVQRVVNQWLMKYGFSVGIKDCVLNEEGQEQIRERVLNGWNNTHAILNEKIPESLQSEGEGTVMRILSKLLVQTGDAVQTHLKDNNISNMVRAGSKGNPINLSQICGCVGQQSVEGKRIHPESSTRTLSCFDFNETSINANGFVQNSYALGLEPHEYFFHAMGGREGLVDTAVKTATTGYIQRRQMKAMEDNRVCYDGTVRNAQGSVIQFIYGGDGNDPCRLEKLQLKCITDSKENIQKFMLDHNPTEIQKQELENLLQLVKDIRTGRFCALAASLDNTVLLPINLNRMLQGWHTSEEEVVSEEYCFQETQASLEEMERSARGNILCAKAAISYYLCSKNLRRYKLSHNEVKSLCQKIIGKNIAAACSAGEMVGSIAAQSLGEPCTQMTLNSVDWTTFMAVKWTGDSPPPAAPDAEVGAFIDALMEAYEDKVEVQADGVTKYLPLSPGTAQALSPDEHGNMMWTELEAVTKHPPINEDGSNTLVKVLTASGQEVVVTKGKSLLIEKDGKLVETEGKDVNIGDRVPIVAKLPIHQIDMYFNLRTIFKETKVIFTDNIIQAKAAMECSRHWWSEGNFKDKLPYSRSDAVVESIRDRPSLLKPGMCTTLCTGGRGSTTIPQHMLLDRSFGFFIGAYLAEGCLTEHQVHISNIDEDYRNACKEFGDKYNINSHITNLAHQTKNGGKSISIMFHSTLLVRLLEIICGKTSYGKRMPSFALTAPDEFVYGLLDGYFSGDGSISEKQKYITASSRSKALRDGMSLLLTRIGIRSSLSQSEVQNKYNTVEGLHGEHKPFYTLQVNASGTHKFANDVHLTIKYKQDRLDVIKNLNCKSQKTQTLMNDVFLDKIIDIQDIPSSHEHVYDLTVAKTRNMTTISGFAQRDTFHSAGIGSKNVTLGIPRLKEILDFTRKIRTPSNTIRFKSPFCYKADFAENLANGLPNLKLCDVVERMELLYDPDFDKTIYENDQLMISIDSYYTKIPETSSKWVARLSLSKAEIKRYHLDPPKLGSIIKERISDKVHVITSEVNSLEWWIRFRYYDMNQMIVQGFGNSKDMQQNLAHRVTLMLMDQIQLSGHPQIQSASVHEIEVWNESLLKNEKQYTVLARGNVLDSISCIDCVDWHNTVTNDVIEALELFGIEAAAAIIYHEIKATVSFDGTYVDSRHLMMVADTMTYRGFVMPISRHGINRTNTGPLVRCSFEETADVLYDAAMFGESDDARGVTQNIMTGQMTNLGTGSFDLFMPDWSLPREGHIKERQTKLVKSRIRKRTSELEKAPDTLEYVDMKSWKGSSDETQIEMPFVEEPSSSVHVQNHQYATINKPKVEPETSSQSVQSYKPSSPKVLVN